MKINLYIFDIFEELNKLLIQNVIDIKELTFITFRTSALTCSFLERCE